MKITKSNAIINSSYRLSLNEMRIVLYGLSHIDPTAEEFPLEHEIHISELAKFFNIGEKDRGSFYDNIKYALITKFWERDFSYFDEEINKIVKRRWLIEVTYGVNDGTLGYSYNPKIKKELQQLASRFTSYFLTNVADMKSAYSMRIYEIAVMYLNASGVAKAVFTKEIEELKFVLDISDKYQQFFNFKARVLETARKEINKLSDIRISYEVIKFGRYPKEIKFTVRKKKEKTEEQLMLLTAGSTNNIHIPLKTLDKAKELTVRAGTGWDFYVLQEQFFDFVKRKGEPDNMEGAFLGFIKKKISKSP